MNMKLKRIKRIIVPSKKINYFVFSVLVLGIISGCIFLTILSKTDKELVVSKLNELLTNIKNNNINFLDTFKNSMISNTIFIIAMFILGMTIIGIIINVLLVYIKGFILGFSISSMIYTLGIKGVVAALIYIFPGQLINILIILLLGIYSIKFTLHLTREVWRKESRHENRELRKYIVIFGVTVILAGLSSLSEAFVYPSLMGLCINMFI